MQNMLFLKSFKQGNGGISAIWQEVKNQEIQT